MKRHEKPVGVDLFCGAGGMSLGFEQAGFDVVAAIDAEPIHVRTHATNFPGCKTLRSDLAQITGKAIRQLAGLRNRHIDVVFGGPPCQGFSSIGRRDPSDPRNQLLQHFARIVMELQPSFFVVENVVGMLSAKSEPFVTAFLGLVEREYCVEKPYVLNASDHGVPQRRRRVFFIGYRKHLSAPAHLLKFSEQSLPGPSVWDAIRDLAEIDKFDGLVDNDIFRGELPPALSQYARTLRGEEKDGHDCSLPRAWSDEGLSGCRHTVHTPNVIQRFSSTEPGTVEPISRFYRLTKDGVSCTLRAGSGVSEGSHTAARPIHPVYPRCITLREAARLHSFPDWFAFHPTTWHGFRQVGNSVPPFLARSVAKPIYGALCSD